MKRQDYLKIGHQPSLNIIMLGLLSFISGATSAGDRIAGRDFATRSEVIAPEIKLNKPNIMIFRLG